MKWEYRLVDNGEIIEVREIYYEKDSIEGYSKPVTPFGLDVDEVGDDICLMMQAVDKPVLSLDEISTYANEMSEEDL